MSQPRPVLAIVGAGAMGLAVARRLGPSSHILIGDVSPTNLSAAEEALSSAGFVFTALEVDLSDKVSVSRFADVAAKTGPVKTIVVPAGVSGAAKNPEVIFATNLLGVAYAIDAFLPVVAPGGSMTIISSVAGHMDPPNVPLDTHLATAPISSLLQHPDLEVSGDTHRAYYLSKRGCIVRAQYSAIAWGRKGARINTVSPGGVMTPMLLQVLGSSHKETSQGLIDVIPVGRIGTPEDIAGAVAFLAGPDAGFITGTDLLVDGGTIPTHRFRDAMPVPETGPKTEA